RHCDFRIFGRFLVGLLLAGLLFSFIGFIPDRALVLITLGIVPFLVVLVPRRYVPQATSRGGAELCGFFNTCLQFLAGVSRPLLAASFVRSPMERPATVATKAAWQAAAPSATRVSFGDALSNAEPVHAIVLGLAVVMAIVGTSLSKFVLERLSDHQFRRWTQILVMVIGAVYLTQGCYLLLTR